MGKIYYNSNIILYDEAEHKTLLDILRDNSIPFNAPCGGNKTCKKCAVKILFGNLVVNGEVSSVSDTVVLACESVPLGDISLEAVTEGAIEAQSDFASLRHGKADLQTAPLGVAVDLGTTTIVLYFCNLRSGEIVAIQTLDNPQRSYGADVISRIKQADAPLMQKLVVRQINEILLQTAKAYHFDTLQIQRMVFAGNTVMEHFLSGKDASSIGEAPYTPKSLFGIEERAMNLGLKIDPRGTVYLSPCVSGFVGGDITAGMLYCSIDRIRETILYIDIGTNGEITLKFDGKIYCCAAAAGPAFEGANISCGMGGQAGAISSVTLTSEHEISIQTIHDTVPVGICGSGLVDAMAVFLKLSKIDETGRIVSGEDSIPLAEGITLTQKDIREVQLAKSAICAGILTLLHEAKITPDCVNKVLLAGGFGTKINPKNACAIGLIPPELSNRITAVGNAAGAGAVKVLILPEEQDRLQALADGCRYFELSDSKFFNEEFINQMMF